MRCSATAMMSPSGWQQQVKPLVSRHSHHSGHCRRCLHHGGRDRGPLVGAIFTSCAGGSQMRGSSGDEHTTLSISCVVGGSSHAWDPQGIRLPQPASVQQPSRRFCRQRTTTRHRQAASCHSYGAGCGGHGDWCTRMPTYVHPREAMSRFAVATAVHGISMVMPMTLHEPRPLH